MAMIELCERGLIPDSLTRYGIRRLCTQRLKDEGAHDASLAQRRYRELLARLGESPIAIETAAANEQHYEVPTRFFQLCLGRRLKYSSCYYPTGRETLDEAEEAMLALYGERAGLADGQDILELGCGWGSLTLWMAERYPNARITAVSNSNGQREHIESICRQRGWTHVRVLTRDVNRLELPSGRFDRCVSIEMFEHMRNYDSLFARIADWLKPDGKLFVHIFCHRQLMYPFETEGEDNWMGRYFFTGGLMPCPAAFTILLVCLQIKRVTLGFSMVAAFSFGLALTMVLTGVLAAWSVQKAQRSFSGFGEWMRRAPYISCALLVVLGVITASFGTSGTIYACAEKPVVDPEGEIARLLGGLLAHQPAGDLLRCFTVDLPLLDRREIGCELGAWRVRHAGERGVRQRFGLFANRGDEARMLFLTGGATTARWGQPHDNIHAVQVELNRALYMDEDDGDPRPERFDWLADVCAGLVDRLTALVDAGALRG
mgnify:CR=1 FL=1